MPLNNLLKIATNLFKKDASKNTSLKIPSNDTAKRAWHKDSNSYTKNGEDPATFYHGTINNFDTFNDTKSFKGWHFFSESPEFANDYAAHWKDGGNVLPVHLKAKNTFNPYDEKSIAEYSKYLKNTEKWNEERIANHIYDIKDEAVGWTEMETSTFKNFIDNSKYDSFIVRENGQYNMAVRNPEQIKGKYSKTFTDTEKNMMKAVVPVGVGINSTNNRALQIKRLQEEDQPLENMLLGF